MYLMRGLSGVFLLTKQKKIDIMTNEERIYKLCEYIDDLIYEISYHDVQLGEHLKWISEEINSIRKDIDNS